MSKGSVVYQRAHELFGDRSEHPSSCTFFLLEASKWIKIQDIPACTSHFPLGRRTLRGEHHLCGDERAANMLNWMQKSV